MYIASAAEACRTIKKDVLKKIHENSHHLLTFLKKHLGPHINWSNALVVGPGSACIYCAKYEKRPIMKFGISSTTTTIVQSKTRNGT